MPTHPSKQTETAASSENIDTTGGGGIRVATEEEQRKLREERDQSTEQENIELTPEEEEEWQRYLKSIRERRRGEAEKAEEKEKRPFEDYTFKELIQAREKAILEGDARKANEIAREHDRRRSQRREK